MCSSFVTRFIIYRREIQSFFLFYFLDSNYKPSRINLANLERSLLNSLVKSFRISKSGRENNTSVYETIVSPDVATYISSKTPSLAKLSALSAVTERRGEDESRNRIIPRSGPSSTVVEGR